MRLIAVGYPLKRLTAKCANSFVIKRKSTELQPTQVGVGVSGGAEAVVNAIRRLLSSLPDNHVFVKLDFSNAFNSVRRDTILANVAVNMPELYRFVKDSLNCNPMLWRRHHHLGRKFPARRSTQRTGVLRVHPANITRD